MEHKSDAIWVCTNRKIKKDVIEAAKWKVKNCFGHVIAEITSIQSQFKSKDLWHSHVWYNYKLEGSVK